MRTGRSSPPYPSLPPSKSRSGIRALPASPSVRSSSLPGSLPSVSTTATRPSPILLRRVRPRWPTMVRFPFPSSYPELPIPCHLPGRKPNPVRREKTVQMQDTYQQQYGHYPETVHRYQEQRRYYFRYCHRFIPAFRQDSFRNGYCRSGWWHPWLQGRLQDLLRRQRGQCAVRQRQPVHQIQRFHGQN